MKIWQGALVAVAAFGFGLPAVAQMAGGPEQRGEVEAKVRARLNRFDANHDGVVTREEIMAYTDTRMKAHEADEFTAMDTNRDGMISRAEFDDYHAKMRAMMRADGMGGDRIGMVGHGDVPPPPRGDHGPHMGMMGRPDDMTDGGDRIVINDEVKRALARFDLVDTNHDGIVSPEERRAYRAMHEGSQAPVK